MKNFKIFADLMTVEIRYSYGHLFWDRCGQTVLDIETKCDGWFSARDPKHSGRLENPEKDMYLSYTDSAYIFSVKKPEELNNDLIIEELQKTWKIVRANFGVEEYDRLGCRFHFLKPTTSVEDSEKLIKNSEFNVKIPDHIKEHNYDLNIRQVIAIFEKEEIEYRLELKGITRSHSIDPSGLYTGRTEKLPKNQKKHRLLKIKRMAAYSADPMYAVMLDIDCVYYNPEQVSIGEHIKQQTVIVQKDFLPILEKL